MPPQLDDLGTKQVISGTPASDDLLPFYDISEFGNDKLKKTTVAALLGGAGGSTDSLTTSDGSAAATAGKLGELISDIAGVTVLSDGTREEIASVVLTPGQWVIYGMVTFSSTLATTASVEVDIAAGIPPNNSTVYLPWTQTSGSGKITAVVSPRHVRFDSGFAASITFRLYAAADFSGGDVNAEYGELIALRVR